MKTIILLLLAMQAGAQTIRSNGPEGIGSAQSASSFTITGSGSQCLYVSSSGATDPAIMANCANARVAIGTASPATQLHSLTVTASTQALFSGYSQIAGIVPTAGQIQLGSNAAFAGVLQYSPSATTVLSFDNTYDNATALMKFRMRTAGTAVEVITVDGAGDIVFPSGTFKPWPRTRAQISALTPGSVGEYVDCTDCTLPGLCRSTGTAIAQWRKVEGPSTLGCGVGN